MKPTTAKAVCFCGRLCFKGLSLLPLAVAWVHSSLAATSLDDRALREKVESSVVKVLDERGGFGSGFVLNTQGYVATNHHVIEDGSEFAVQQGTLRTSASLVWSSAALDLAVIRIEGSTAAFTPVELAVSSPDLNADLTVHAVGYPGISDHAATSDEAVPTYTEGTLGRITERAMLGYPLRVIQHDAGVNMGNSGGPLFDACGRVIGVNTWGPAHRVIDTESGPRIVTVISGGAIPEVTSDISWASFIGELAEQLDSQSIDYSSTTDTCEKGIVVGGASPEQLDELRQLIADLESQLAEGSGNRDQGEQDDVLREQLERAKAEVERIEAEAFSKLLMTVLVAFGSIVAVIVIAAVMFTSFRRSVLGAVGRVHQGVSHVVLRSSKRHRQQKPASAREESGPLRIRVGRGRDMNVVLRDGSVSRHHLDLTVSPPSVGGGGRSYRLEDLGSTNGTKVLRHGRWIQVRRESVGPREQLRLGDYRTTAADLESLALRKRAGGGGKGQGQGNAGFNQGQPAGVGVKRNRSGEVVARSRRPA